VKLISKTLLYYLLISLPLLIISGIFSYYLIQNELRDGTDESLQKEKIYAEDIIKTFKEPHAIFLSTDSLSTAIPIKSSKKTDIYSDVSIYDKTEQEHVNYRVLKSYFSYNNQTYLITISKTTLEEDELMEGLFSAFGLIISFLVLGFLLVNWLLSKILWKPFYKTLQGLNSYEIKNHEQRHFAPVNTLEFNQLNDALNKMTEKIYTDFIQQKEFTENASHEMQTPLAVIKANLDLLIQSPHLKEEEMNHLQAIENTTKKLASLNKALILLSKIDNHQFKESGSMSLKTVIDKVTHQYADVIQTKKISLDVIIDADATINMNLALADILISNLLQNAIRHNIDGGKISIHLNQHALSISNSGKPLTIDPKDLFVRFKKDDSSIDSLGIGLSITKSILDSYGYTISYHYLNQLHVFEIKF
jgi:signal transduction histidine kinase